MTALRRASCVIVVLMVSAGAAQAQVCETTADTTTICRMVLTEPQALNIRATWRPSASSPRGSNLSLAVNGHICARGRAGGWFGGGQACHLMLPAGLTVIEAATDAPGRVQVQATPSNRLAALPRDAKALDPRKSLLAQLFWP